MSKNIVAKTGEYTNGAGETKSEWTRIGVILSNQNGDYILLDPSVNLSGVLQKQNMLAVDQKKAGNDKSKVGRAVMCSIFDKDQGIGVNQQGNAPAQQSAPPPQDNFDEIPF